MKTGLQTVLHLEHVAADGTDPQWFDASTGGVSALSPRSVQYAPCIDGASVSKLQESIQDGRTSKGPGQAADVSLTLLRHVSGEDRLAVLDGRNFLGRQATVGWVGTGADGTVYTPSAPLVLATGKVVPPATLDPLASKVKLTIRPHYDLSRTVLPDRALLGYRTGVLGNGDGAATTVIAVSGYTTMPVALTAASLVLVPRVWDIGASDVHCIMGTKAFHFGAKLASDGYSWQLFASYSIDGSGTLEEIEGPEIAPDEQLHFLSVQFTTTTKTAVFGVDTTFSTVVGTAAYVAPATEQWQMMRFRSDATTVTSTLMAAWMLFSAAIGEAAVTQLAKSRAQGDEANLVLFFPETDGAGTLLDFTEANASSPLNGTITAGTETSLFEGPPEMAGVKPPLILQAQHMGLVPVDHARLIYRGSKYPIENASRVMDGGVDITIAQRYGVRDLIKNAPASGEVAFTPDMGGLFRFEALRDSAELAADIQGSSGWPMSLALGVDHASAHIDFGSSVGPALVAGDGWAAEFLFSYGGSPQAGAPALWNSGFLLMRLRGFFSGRVYFEAVIEGGAGGDLVLDIGPLPTYTTIAVRVEAWNSGSDLLGRVLINGKVAASGTATGASITNQAFAFKFATGGALFAHVGALPISVWTLPSPGSRTDADAEADHRAHILKHPSFSDPNLLGYWYRFTTDEAQVDDETGNGYHGTIVNSGTHGRWRPGLCWSDPLSATAYLLRERGGYDLDTGLEITEAAWQGIAPEASDLWFEGEVNLSEALFWAAGPGFVDLRADQTLVLGLIVAATAGNSQGVLSGVLSVSDRVLRNTGGGASFPPSLVVGEYGRIGAEGQTALSAADSERRALMSTPLREDKIPIRDNAAIYGDPEFPAGIQHYATSRYRDARPTRAVLELLKTLWADPRPIFDISLEGAGRALQPGDIWTFTDPRKSVSERVLIIARVADPHREVVTVR